MDFGVSLFLIAIGAILDFAISTSVSGVDIHTVGVILMVAGGAGLLWSLISLGVSSRGDVRETWYRPTHRTIEHREEI